MKNKNKEDRYAHEDVLQRALSSLGEFFASKFKRVNKKKFKNIYIKTYALIQFEHVFIPLEGGFELV